MYHYIVDPSRLPTKNFDRLIGEVYGFLTEYQISGEVHRVTRLRNIHELTDSALKSGAKTVIAIGDDETFLQLLQILAEVPGLVLGFIPLTSQSMVADILGLGNLAESCKAIAQRRVDEFDLAQVNRNYFFTSISFGPWNSLLGEMSGKGIFQGLRVVNKLRSAPPMPISIKIDNNYTVLNNIIAGLIINTRTTSLVSARRGLITSSHDNRLDLMLVPKLSGSGLFKYRGELVSAHLEQIPGTTVLHGKHFQIDGPLNATVLSGSLPVARLPLAVSVAPYRLRVIIGRGRTI